ncbi:MAG: EAL domain-containing protein [Acidimicrobiales bacterium]
MLPHNKRLVFTVRVDRSNPQFARLLLEQFGGANGELGAAMRYFTQAWNEPDEARRGGACWPTSPPRSCRTSRWWGQALVLLMKGSPAAEVDKVEGSYLGNLLSGNHEDYVELSTTALAVMRTMASVGSWILGSGTPRAGCRRCRDGRLRSAGPAVERRLAPHPLLADRDRPGRGPGTSAGVPVAEPVLVAVGDPEGKGEPGHRDGGPGELHVEQRGPCARHCRNPTVGDRRKLRPEFADNQDGVSMALADTQTGEHDRGAPGALTLVAELTAMLEVAGPAEVFGTACAGFARLLDVYRCGSWTEDAVGRITCWHSSLDPSLGPSVEATLPSAEAVARWFDDAWSQHGPVEHTWRGRLATATPGAEREVSLLVVPIGRRAAYLLEGGAGWDCPPPQLELIRVAAALTRQHSREARTAREQEHHTAANDALHRLLQMGVQARSPIEAAKALASTAAQVLDFPVGCAYLVDEHGIITEVVSVGTDDVHAARLRDHLVGKLARGSPVWRRTVEGDQAGPDLVDDTARHGVVRQGGVAQSLDLRAMAAIPLLSSDGPLGLVLCGDHEPRERWRVGDRELLAQLALEGAVVVDNARLRASERFEATHDSLTGLLNRRAFSAQLREAAVASAERGEPVATLLLDLDRFKEVNDHLGHHRGDELLVAVAERLRRCMQPTDALARLGGDEFALLLRRHGTQHRAEAVAAQVSALLDEAFEVDDCLLHVDASIGIACSPLHAVDVDGLLKQADAAMYAAKRSGLDYLVYGPEVAAQNVSDLGLLGELRRTLDAGEQLLLHYQPKIDLRTGTVSGVEALVRWEHPRHGLLGPDRFVPMAEETGLIRALTNWVVPEALRQVRRWGEEDGLELQVAVNVSARDVGDPTFADRVASWLEAAGVPGSRLLVEVTEGSVVTDRPQASAALTRLRQLGVSSSLDDFGTGYSSLAYLETLPVDEVKIDRQFLHLARSRGSVIRSIASLAHELDMRVVAEGVESPEQVAWVIEAGCDEAQGFHFSRPVEAPALARWARGEEAAYPSPGVGTTAAGVCAGTSSSRSSDGPSETTR